MKSRILFKKKEASAQIYAVLIIAIVILIAVAVYMVYSPSEDDNVWTDPIDEDDLEIGDFGQELILRYADGTLQSVKPIVNGLTIWYDDKEVSGINYKLKVKATGGSQDTVKIDISGFMLKAYTFNNPTDIKNTYTLGTGNSVITVNVDGDWHTVVEWDAEIDHIIPNSLANSPWYVRFTPDGILKYKENLDWKIADNPDYIQLAFAKTGSTGQIVIKFSGTATPG